MQMLYNSDHYAVVQFDAPADAAPGPDGREGLARGGYEIVDKFARREIYLEGVMAESFKLGVEALIAGEPSQDEIDDYLARYSQLAQQPVVLH